ncbi:GntR family transcriptional regulator [Streptacidiphilus sp. PAMC 29251]
MDIIRNQPLYQQAANVLRQGIADGEYPPGSALPSEDTLAKRFKLSRPTVRQAIASLRSEGLVDVVMGKGSFIRATATGQAAALERSVTRTGSRYITPADAWTESEPPTVNRSTADATTMLLLGLDEGEAMITVDRTLTDPDTGTRRLQRVTIPEATASTSLAGEPARPVAELYTALAATGHKLAWTETVRARMPHPEESTALRLSDATPLLSLLRITTDATTESPLMLEELRMGAHDAAPTYEITARARRSHRIP